LLSDASFGAAFFVLLNHVCAREAQGRMNPRAFWVRSLAFVGIWSYSLYLTQEPVLAAAKQLGLRVGLGIPGLAIAPVPVPLLAAFVFYRVIEVRFINASRMRRARHQELSRAEMIIR